MAVPYEKIVAEDLNTGYGSVDVTMPAGGTAAGQKVGIHSLLGLAVVSAADFSGSPDVGAQITAAIAALPSTGGIVDVRSLSGARTMTSKVTITKANVTVLFGSLTLTLSGVAGAQSPFGAYFLIEAANVWLIGDGTTRFVNAAGSTANQITFYYGGSRGGVRGIEGDGNKANVTSLSDDTFQSFVQVISDSGGGSTADSQTTIEDCVMHDFNHYGVVTYGNLSSGNIIRRNRIYSNGKNDTYGTGDGIYINKGSSRNDVSGNHCYSNQRSGIRLSTAGLAHVANKVTNNWCYSNGIHGIFADEAANISSVNGVGQTGLLLAGNHCYANTEDGIRIGAYDSVGFITNYAVTDNVLYSNGGWGLIVQSSAHATNNVRRGNISGNQAFSNTQYGIDVQSDVLDTLVVQNTAIGNTAGEIRDLATRTVQAGNKTNTSDGTWHVPSPITSEGLVTAANFATAGYSQWNDPAVRSWTAQATGGQLLFQSGDGHGTYYFAGDGQIQLPTTTFANLASPGPNTGVIRHCSNCTKTTPCGGGGTGAIAKYLNGAWDCD